MTPLQLIAIFIAALPIIGMITGFILIRRDYKRRLVEVEQTAEETIQLRKRNQEFARIIAARQTLQDHSLRTRLYRPLLHTNPKPHRHL